MFRYFEDRARFRTAKALLDHGDVEFFIALQNAQDGLVWATRWIWNQCPRLDAKKLELDWDVYGEAAQLFLHSADYYHLFRCIVLCRRDYFNARVNGSEKKVRFTFRSDEEKERDAARQLRETKQDAEFLPSGSLRRFLGEWIPILEELFPCWVEKLDEHSIRYTVPSLISWVFDRWAGLLSRQMRFELPGTWQFGDYSLDQFRSFWKSILAVALTHSFAHMLGDQTLGTAGLATGSAVMHVTEEDLEGLSNRFPLALNARRLIIRDLTYSPIPATAYWDPIWQPLFRLDDNSFLVSPGLILGSSAERNLVTLLNKRPQTRRLYHQVSLEKETEQLDELEPLFLPNDRFLKRRRVPVKRKDGNILSDIDLLVVDRLEGSTMIIQAKWLIRPDYVTEVLARDEEISKALKVMVELVDRVHELGAQWLSQVLSENVLIDPTKTTGLVINRDFLPSGWVKDQRIPLADMPFVRNFISSPTFTGLQSLHEAAYHLDEDLVCELAIKETSEIVQLGDYTFEWPAMER